MRADYDTDRIILIEDGWQMYRTGDPEHKTSGLEALARMLELHPDKEYRFEEWKAEICRNNPKTMLCTAWDKREGWSIWERKETGTGLGRSR